MLERWKQAERLLVIAVMRILDVFLVWMKIYGGALLSIYQEINLN